MYTALPKDKDHKLSDVVWLCTVLLLRINGLKSWYDAAVNRYQFLWEPVQMRWTLALLQLEVLHIGHKR